MMSEESFVTTVQEQELDHNISVSDRSVQVDLPPHSGDVTPRHRHHRSKLQRHHTSDLILDRRSGSYHNNLPYTKTISRSPYPSRIRYDPQYFRPKSVGFDYPFFASRSGQFGSDSGYGGTRRTKLYYQSTESPTFSVTPPNSLDYLYESRGDRSSAGSITPNGMTNSNGMMNSGKSINCVYLNPQYLQNTFLQNHAGSDTQLALGSRTSGSSCQCTCRCGALGDAGEPPPAPPAPRQLSADGLSWRRLHMSRAKLKATATTSELLSGFAMIAMVELQINEPTNVPEWLFVMFAVCTTVLVAIHIFALMISTYLLPNIDAVSKMGDGGAEDVIRDSPHERMRGFIELAWAFSTVLGLFLFLVEIAILCWVKFWDYSFAAATAATVIVIPVLIVFVAFAIHFYHSLVVQKCESSHDDMERLENMKKNLDSATMKAGSPV